MYACYIGFEDIVSLLLETGVSINVKNHKGQMPLMLAAGCGNKNVAHFLIQVSVSNWGYYCNIAISIGRL